MSLLFHRLCLRGTSDCQQRSSSYLLRRRTWRHSLPSPEGQTPRIFSVTTLNIPVSVSHMRIRLNRTELGILAKGHLFAALARQSSVSEYFRWCSTSGKRPERQVHCTGLLPDRQPTATTHQPSRITGYIILTTRNEQKGKLTMLVVQKKKRVHRSHSYTTRYRCT